jgi:hypothetical protein
MRTAILFCLTGLLLATLPAAGEAQLERTNPQHFGSGPGDDLYLNEGRSLPDYKTPNPRSRVLTRRDRDLTDFGAPDRRLSAACRKGDFLQRTDHRYVAVLNDKVYGAVLGGSRMLHDPQRMAQSGIIYAFVGQGTTNCRVYQIGSQTGA